MHLHKALEADSQPLLWLEELLLTFCAYPAGVAVDVTACLEGIVTQQYSRISTACRLCL